MHSPKTLKTILATLYLALVAAAGSMIAVTPSVAQGSQAIVSANLNMRAGPNTNYPVVMVVPVQSSITLLGCLNGVTWCEGVYQGYHGWMNARYLQVYDGGRYAFVSDYARVATVPSLTFNFSVYWDNYYRNQPFYAQRARYAPAGIQVSAFYDSLSPHGSWIYYQNQYVWVPRVNSQWRPYTEGRWAYTSAYGWMWVSYEPFGWAAYHYGRWAYSSRVGWFWVPGTQWAPAWVAWRTSGDYYAWAPLPPNTINSVSINVSFGSIPTYYWQAAPSRSFLSVNLSAEIVRDRTQLQTVVQQTQPAGSVTIVNNVVVNNVVNVQVVEEQTQQTVVTYDVALTNDETTATDEPQGNTIEIFQPAATQTAEQSEPSAVATIEEVAQQTETAGLELDEPTTEDLVLPPPPPEEVLPPTEAPIALQDIPLATELTPQAVPAELAEPVAPVAPAVGDEPAAEPASPAGEEVLPPAVEAPQAPVCPEGFVRVEEGGECLPLCPDATLPLLDGSCPVTEPAG